MHYANFHSMILALFGVAAAVTGVSVHAAEPKAAELRLDQLLWREVQNKQGQALGSVSDVLVQMPSGRIVFVAVDPLELFARPRVLPPGAITLPGETDGPVHVDVTLERWLEAPRLDWDAELIIKNTKEGGEIYGYYQQAWQEPEPTPPWGMTVVADADVQQPVRYVSLKNLLLERVVTHAGQQAGYVRDFLVDWAARRATHALVSPQWVPSSQMEQMWFAIPTPLLNPPIKDDALTANAGVEMFRRAKPLEHGQAMPTGAAEIFRYPAPRE